MNMERGVPARVGQPAGRSGIAIILVLMLILAGGALAHGAFLMARAELSAARARADGVARAAAERRRLASAMSRGDLTGARAIGPWDTWTVADSVMEPPVTLRRLGAESWWASVSAGGRRRPGSPGLLLWWLDAASRVEALDGVVRVGVEAPVVAEGSVDRLAWNAPEPPLTMAMCAAEAPSSLVADPPARIALLDSAVVRPSLGLLALDTLLARTPTTLEGGGTPAPVERTAECVTDDPWNWGDPERPTRPCGAYLAVRSAPSTLRIVGGVGQGAWVVDGDVVLVEGARLFGFILASGALVLEDGASFHGAAVAAGGFHSEAGTVVRGSACWAERVLAAAAAIWVPRPERVPGLPMIVP